MEKVKNVALNSFKNDRLLTTHDSTTSQIVTSAIKFTTREDSTFQMDTQKTRNLSSMSIVPKITQTSITTATSVTNVVIDKNDSPIHVILGKLQNFKPSKSYQKVI